MDSRDELTVASFIESKGIEIIEAYLKQSSEWKVEEPKVKPLQNNDESWIVGYHFTVGEKDFSFGFTDEALEVFIDCGQYDKNFALDAILRNAQNTDFFIVDTKLFEDYQIGRT